jgi:hypothetical protein
MDQAADIDARVSEDAVRRTELLMDQGKGLGYLGFVADVTGQATAPLAPSATASAAACFALSPFLSRMATRSPRRAHRRAVARPMPPPPPVTMMSRFCAMEIRF